MENISETAAANFKHMLRLSHILVQTVTNEASLSTKHHERLVASLLCMVQMSRIVNMCEYLHKIDESSLFDKIQTFEIKNLVQEISDAFYNTLSNYLTIDIKLSMSLKDTTCVIVDKTRFELAVLNLLYCSVKTNSAGETEPIKLTITVKENKDNVIFLIKDNNRPSSTESVAKTFKFSRSNTFLPDNPSEESLLSISVKAAQMATEHMKGSLVYTPMKSGNKYELSLPKRLENIHKMQYISQYIPTQSYFREIFADICAEHALKNVEDAFEGLDKLLL